MCWRTHMCWLYSKLVPCTFPHTRALVRARVRRHAWPRFHLLLAEDYGGLENRMRLGKPLTNLLLSRCNATLKGISNPEHRRQVSQIATQRAKA